MQFNPVVLSVEMPVCKIFVTKIQKTGRIWTNYTKKQKASLLKRGFLTFLWDAFPTIMIGCVKWTERRQPEWQAQEWKRGAIMKKVIVVLVSIAMLLLGAACGAETPGKKGGAEAFEPECYWSSTVLPSGNTAFVQGFGIGKQLSYGLSVECRVRAVRLIQL